MAHKDVHAAILAVMQDVPYLQKEYLSKLGYAAATEAAIFDKLRPAIVKHGLVIVPTEVEVTHTEVYQTSGNKSMNRVIVRCKYAITHSDSGTSQVASAVGEGADVGDKATGKAMTNAQKYVMREAFLIETGTDPDRDASVPRAAAPQEPAKQDASYDRYKKVLAALQAAVSIEKLDQYREGYLKIGFPQEQLQDLDRICQARYEFLKSQQPVPV